MSPQCENCGGHVTPKFVRIFGRDDGVDACPRCSSRGERANGAGAATEEHR